MRTEIPPKHLTLDQRHDWYRVYMPNEPYFCYIGANGTKNFITRASIGKAIYRSLDIIYSEIPESQHGSPADGPLVVAFLANTDYPSFIALLYGHLRLTHSISGRPVLPFLISPRNSAAAIAHLLKETRSAYVWVTDGPMTELAEEAFKVNVELKAQLRRFPSFDDLFHTDPFNLPETYDSAIVPLSTPFVILHSSGSTAFPKIRYFTHEMGIQWTAILTSTKHYQLEGEIFALSPPPYHAMGLFMTWIAVSSRVTLAINSPFATPGPMSSEAFFDLIRKLDASYAFSIPSYLEEWSQDPMAVEYLRTRKAIVWGGGPLNREIGAQLYKQGVSLRMLYGSTEFGSLNYPLGQIIEEGPEWFSFRPDSDVKLIPTDEKNVFQVVVKRSKTQDLSAYNMEVDGVPAFDTNDLVQMHPKNHNIYCVVGRADDQIMLSTGEKTNPGPLEQIIKRNPHIQDVILFGRGRQSNGILIQPVSFGESEKLGIEGFRNLIWPSIEEANAYAPAHSRILKEMILVASPSKPFIYTAKETLKKGDILSIYADEINTLYKDAEDSVHATIPIPLGSHPDGGWTEEESREFVRRVICLILRIGETKAISDSGDIFGYGCDSLQATYIRNTLLHALRQVAPLPNVRGLPINFVYQTPTIDGLSRLLTQASRSEPYKYDKETLELRRLRLENLISQYTLNWPTHNPQKDGGSAEVVLLTGSTGGLGSQLLAQLLQLPTISRIYALNRPGNKSSYDRHADAFRDRGNDAELLKSPKLIFAEGDTSMQGFALDLKLFNEIRDSVTTILHNGWNVNFNISLASMEPAIRGVRHLIDFALSSPFATPPPLIFISSVGIVKPWSDIPIVKEEPFLNIDLLQTSGYGESKWVSERILSLAGQNTPLKPVVIRVGQLSGGLNGNWNTREWFPSIITASQIIGSLPDSNGVVSFVPVHKAASAVIELRNAPVPFAHIVHPRPSNWQQLISFVSDELKLPVVPFPEWVDQLAKLPRSEEMLRKTQAPHLIDFYKGAIPASDAVFISPHEVMGLPIFDTKQATVVAESLNEKNLPGLTRDEVVQWIGYWRNKGILD